MKDIQGQIDKYEGILWDLENANRLSNPSDDKKKKKKIEQTKKKIASLKKKLVESKTMKLTKRSLKEALAFTEKYDDDSALKGDQSKLPDDLQKAIIDDTVEKREEHEEEERKEKEKNEGVTLDNMPDSWRQILGGCLGEGYEGRYFNQHGTGQHSPDEQFSEDIHFILDTSPSESSYWRQAYEVIEALDEDEKYMGEVIAERMWERHTNRNYDYSRW